MGLEPLKTDQVTDQPFEPDERTFAFLSGLGRHLIHELNNPISAIASSIYLIKDIINTGNGTVSMEDIQPFLDGIEEECNGLKSVVEEFSKYVSTKSLILLPIDLVEFVRARAADLSREGLSVTCDISENKLITDADAGALTFVLRSLAEAAHSAKARHITFRLDKLDSCQIVVADDREPKLSEAELQEVFSPIPSKSATLPRRTGLGLKLPLAKRIVELHGGTLELSDSASKETEIRILLPLPAQPSA